jgi:hypothetical protein
VCIREDKTALCSAAPFMQTADYNNKTCSRSLQLKFKANHQFVYVKMETSIGSAGVRQYSNICTTDYNNTLISQCSLISIQLSQFCYSVCDTSTFGHYAWTDPKSGFANLIGPTFGVV